MRKLHAHWISVRFVTDLKTMVVNCRRIFRPFVIKKSTRIDWFGTLLCGSAIVVLLNCTSAFGSYITMATNFSVIDSSQGLMLVVTTENRGDVPAHAVQFEVLMADTSFVAPAVEKLEVNEKASVKCPVAGAFGIPGRYPVVIRTYYKDANGYRFTALTVGFYDYKSTAVPVVSIRGYATEIPADGKGRLKFLLRNDGQMAQKIDLALFLPNELSTSRENSTIEVGPHQEVTVVYDVENYSALANSNYQLALVGRYHDAGSHFGVAGSAAVRVAGDVGLAGRPIWVWVFWGGLLPGLIIFLRLQKQ